MAEPKKSFLTDPEFLAEASAGNILADALNNPAFIQKAVVADRRDNDFATGNTFIYDLKHMNYYDLRKRYGKEVVDNRGKWQEEVDRQRSILDAERTASQKVGDFSLSAGSAVTSLVGGLSSALLAIGGVADELYDPTLTGLSEEAAKVSIATGEVSAWIKSFQSQKLADRAALGAVATDLDDAESALQLEQDLAEGRNQYIAGLARMGRDALSAGERIMEDGALAGDILAQGLGSILGSAKVAGAGAKLFREAAGKAGASRVTQKIAGAAGSSAGIGLTEASGIFTQASEEIMNMTEEQLLGSPVYVEFRNSGMDHNQAQLNTSNSVAREASLRQLPAAAALGLLAARFNANPLKAFRGKGFLDGITEVGKQTLEEGFQGASGAFNVSVAIQSQIDEERSLSQGVGGEFVTGAFAGFGIAGTLGAPSTAKATLRGGAVGTIAAADLIAQGVRKAADSKAADIFVTKAADALDATQAAAQKVIKVAEPVTKPVVKVAKKVAAVVGEKVVTPAMQRVEDFNERPNTKLQLETLEASGKAVELAPDNEVVAAVDKIVIELSFTQASKMTDEAILSAADAIQALGRELRTGRLNDEAIVEVRTTLSSPEFRKIKERFQVLKSKAAEAAPDLSKTQTAETKVTKATIKKTLEVAALDPAKVNPDHVAKILKSEDHGLTDDQIKILEVAAAVSRIVDTHRQIQVQVSSNESIALSKKPAYQGKDAPEVTKLEEVSQSIQIAGFTDVRGHKLRSIHDFVADYIAAIQSEDGTVADNTEDEGVIDAASLAENFGMFVEHLRNKVGALNKSAANQTKKGTGTSVMFRSLVGGVRMVAAGIAGGAQAVTFHSNSPKSVRFAETVANDAKVAAEAYNILVRAFPKQFPGGEVAIPELISPTTTAAEAVEVNAADGATTEAQAEGVVQDEAFTETGEQAKEDTKTIKELNGEMDILKKRMRVLRNEKDDAHDKGATDAEINPFFDRMDDQQKLIDAKNAEINAAFKARRAAENEATKKDTKVQLSGDGKFLAKDQKKADKANKFIGRGSANSSTNRYANDFGDQANTGEYTSSDVVFVSAEGNRKGRLRPNEAELQKAIDAEATLLTDNELNRNRPYNVGEREVAEYLSNNGYRESSPGVWTPLKSDTAAGDETIVPRTIDEEADTQATQEEEEAEHQKVASELNDNLRDGLNETQTKEEDDDGKTRNASETKTEEVAPVTETQEKNEVYDDDLKSLNDQGVGTFVPATDAQVKAMRKVVNYITGILGIDLNKRIRNIFMMDVSGFAGYAFWARGIMGFSTEVLLGAKGDVRKSAHVISHEMAHMWDSIMGEGDKLRSVIDGRFSSGKKGDLYLEILAKIAKEPELKQYFAYALDFVNDAVKSQELFAELVAMYVMNPDFAQKHFPKGVNYVEDLIENHAELSELEAGEDSGSDTQEQSSSPSLGTPPTAKFGETFIAGNNEDLEYADGKQLLDLLTEDENTTEGYMTFASEIFQTLMDGMNARLADIKISRADDRSLKEAILEGDDQTHIRDFKNTMLVDPDTGEYNPELLSIAVVAMIDWMSSVRSANPHSRSLRETLKKLGVELQNLNTEDFHNILNGVSPRFVAETVNKRIIKMWNLKVNNKSQMVDARGAVEGLVKEMIEVIADKFDYITLHEVPTKFRKKNGKPVTTPTINVKGLREVQKDMGLTGRDSILRLLTPEDDNGPSIGKRIDHVAKKNKRGTANLSRTERRALRVQQDVPHKLAKGISALISFVGFDTYKKMLGWRDVDHLAKNHPLRNSIEGKNLSIERDWDDAHLVTAELQGDNQETAVYFRISITKTGRHQHTGINSQNNKTLRVMVSPTNATLDMTNQDDIDGFWLTVAQTSGLFKVENVPHEKILAEIQSKFAEKYGEAQKLLENYLNTGKLDRAALFEATGEIEMEQFNSIFAVADLANVSRKTNALTEFYTTLGFELDGKTDGPSHMMNNFGQGLLTEDDYTNFQRVGYFLGSALQNLNKFFANQDNKDLYNEASVRGMTKMYSEMANAPPAQQEALYASARFAAAFGDFRISEIDGLPEMTRDSLKNPMTKTVYGSGLASVAEGITEDMMMGFYKIASKMPKGADPAEYFGYAQFEADFRILFLTKYQKNVDWTQSWLDKGSVEHFAKIVEAGIGEMIATSAKDIIGEPITKVADLLVFITNVQTEFMIKLYDQKLLELAETRAQEGKIERHKTTKKGIQQQLTVEDFVGLIEDVLTYGPTYDNGVQSLAVGAFSPQPSKLELSSTMRGSLQMKSTMSLPELARVKAIPYLTQGRGDAMVVNTIFSDKNPVEGVLAVHDGFYVPINKIKEYSKKINGAVMKVWDRDVLGDTVTDFENFLAKVGSIDLIMLEEALKKTINAPYKTTVTATTIDELMATLKQYHRGNQARKAVFKDLPRSIDHLGGAAEAATSNEDKPEIGREDINDLIADKMGIDRPIRDVSPSRADAIAEIDASNRKKAAAGMRTKMNEAAEKDNTQINLPDERVDDLPAGTEDTGNDVGKSSIQIVKRYSVITVKNSPDTIFIFGDNLVGRGLAGQAAIRGEPNAVGIPTKRLPSKTGDAFFGQEKNLKQEKAAITKAIDKIIALRAEGKTIVFPLDGVGTGFANLEKKAPLVYAHLQKELARAGLPHTVVAETAPPGLLITDTNTVLEILKRNSNRLTIRMAIKMLDVFLANENFKVVIGDTNNVQALSEYYNDQRGDSNIEIPDGVSGWTDLDAKVMYITSNNHETLVHEMIHLVTYNVMLAHFAGTKTNTAVDRLETLMSEFMAIDTGLKGKALKSSMNAAKAAILMNQTNSDPVSKASALNEFIAWTLSNAALTKELKTRDTVLVRMAKSVMILIKRMLGDKIPTDMYSHILFNTLLLQEKWVKLADGKEFGPPDQIPENNAIPDNIVPSVGDGGNTNGVDIDNNGNGDDGGRGNDDDGVTPPAAKQTNFWIDLMREKLANIKAISPGDPDRALKVTQFRKYRNAARDAVSKLDFGGFALSEYEKHTFRAIHLVLATEMRLNAQSSVALNQMFEFITTNLKPKMFGKGKNAQELYSSVMDLLGDTKNDEGVSDAMAVLLALSQTSKKFREALDQLPDPGKVETRDGSLNGFLTSITGHMMEKALGTINIADSGAKELLDVLADNLIREDTEREYTLLRALMGSLDKADKFMNGALNELAERAASVNTRMNEEDRALLTKLVTSTFAISTAFLSSDRATALAKGAKRITHMGVALDHAVFLREFVTEVIGTDGTNAEVMRLLDTTNYGIQAIRQNFREQLPVIMQNAFDTHPDEDQWRALHTVVASLDFSHLFDISNPERSFNLLRDSSLLSSETVKAENKIVANFDKTTSNNILVKAKQLAGSMNKKGPGHQILWNAHAINKLSGNYDEKMTSAIDTLVSLYALEIADTSQKASIIKMYEEDPQAVQNLVTYIQALNKEEDLKEFSEGARMQARKGWIPDHGRKNTLVVIQRDDKRDQMIKMGYVRVGDVTADSEFSTVKRGYYTTTVRQGTAYSQGVLQSVQGTYRGVNAVTGIAVTPDMSGVITGPALNVITSHMNTNRVHDDKEVLAPVHDEEGKIWAYERIVNPDIMAKYAQPKSNLALMLGAWAGRQVEEKLASQYNYELLLELKRIYDDRGSDDDKLFIDISDPTLKDAVYRESWRVISPDTRNQIADIFGEKGGFMIRKDMVNLALGHSDPSIVDVWTGKTRMPKGLQKVIQAGAKAVMGEKAVTIMSRGEEGIQGTVAKAKDIIVVRSLIVPYMNTQANVFQLLTRGVGLKEMNDGYVNKMVELERFNENTIRLMEIDTKIALSGNDKNQVRILQGQKQVILDENLRMSIAPLIKAGQYKNISEGITELDVELTTGRMAEWVENQVNRLPGPIQTIAKYGLLSKDTAVYKIANKAVQYGDFLAKAIYYDHLTQVKGFSDEVALRKIQEEYVNFSVLPGRTRSALEAVGGTWFLSFKIRTMKVALNVMRENPARALILMASGIGEFGSPTNDNLGSVILQERFGYSIGWSMLLGAPELNPWAQLWGWT